MLYEKTGKNIFELQSSFCNVMVLKKYEKNSFLTIFLYKKNTFNNVDFNSALTFLTSKLQTSKN